MTPFLLHSHKSLIMTDGELPLRERFYRERDSRTEDYLGASSPALVPVSIHVSADACETAAGQLLVLTLVNQLARVHRNLGLWLSSPVARLVVPAVCGGTTIGEEIYRLVKRIDPYGLLDLDASVLYPSDISIGIGVHCRTDLMWYLGCSLSNGELAKTPRRIGTGLTADLRGAGVAAVLGAAAAFKNALDINTVPTTLSAWNFRSGDGAEPGPTELPKIDVGRGLMIGAGAVGAAALYWLMQWGNVSTWTTVDGDSVKIHNTNRSLLLFPEDAGWPDREQRSKGSCLEKHLKTVIPICSWYDESKAAEQIHDTVLVLANERNVRTSVSFRNDPLHLQGTTSRSWLSQLHRHIAGRDDCVRCRMADFRAPKLACSEGTISTHDGADEDDAALPFLSAASGLMVVSALQRIQLGDPWKERANVWRWDFRSSLRVHSSGFFECRDTCSTGLGAAARKTIAQKTQWASAPWLATQAERPRMSPLHE